MIRQQREAAFDAMEREDAKWQNRLKRGLRFAVMLTAGVALMILNLAFPKMYPNAAIWGQRQLFLRNHSP